MLSGEQVEQFRRDGFLIAGKVMERDAAASLRERLASVMEGRAAGQPEALRNLTGDNQNVVVQIVNIWEADPLFREHIYHPIICEMAADLMGTDVVRVWHDQVQYKPPRVGGPTTWHQDHPYWPIIQPADLVSAWVALEDADVENGCMSMARGSHRWGRYKDGTIGTSADYLPDPDLSLLPAGSEIDVQPVPVKAGEVVFHHCLTWHGAPPNRSNRGRPAIAVHYMPGHTRYEPTGQHLVQHNVTVAPGELLQGDHFPTVWNRGPVSH